MLVTNFFSFTHYVFNSFLSKCQFFSHIRTDLEFCGLVECYWYQICWCLNNFNLVPQKSMDLEVFADMTSDCWNMSLIWYKTLWEKEKMLYTCILSSYHYVFKKLLKLLWGKENKLVTSILSFSHNVSYQLISLLIFHLQILSDWTGLILCCLGKSERGNTIPIIERCFTFYQMQNFTLVQIEYSCRRQIEGGQNNENFP